MESETTVLKWERICEFCGDIFVAYEETERHCGCRLPARWLTDWRERRDAGTAA